MQVDEGAESRNAIRKTEAPASDVSGHVSDATSDATAMSDADDKKSDNGLMGLEGEVSELEVAASKKRSSGR